MAETTADYEVMRYAQNHKDRRGCYVGEGWVDFRGVTPVLCGGALKRFTGLDEKIEGFI